MNTLVEGFKERFKDCFWQLYGSSDVFAFLLRGHLYCESTLSQLLGNYMDKPDEIDINRLDYATKVDLCCGLGLIDVQLKPGLRQLGAIRNKYVHNLAYKATEQDQTDLINTIRSTVGFPASYFFSRNTEFPNGFRRCVMALWIPLEMHLAVRLGQLREAFEQISEASAENVGVDRGTLVEAMEARMHEFLKSANVSSLDRDQTIEDLRRLKEEFKS